MKNLILLLSVFLSFSTLQASDVSDWFERESNQFLEIMNNNEGTYRLDIYSNGQIHWKAGARNHNWLSLSGINFYVKG